MVEIVAGKMQGNGPAPDKTSTILIFFNALKGEIFERRAPSSVNLKCRQALKGRTALSFYEVLWQ